MKMDDQKTTISVYADEKEAIDAAQQFLVDELGTVPTKGEAAKIACWRMMDSADKECAEA